MTKTGVTIKSPQEIGAMRRAGRVVACVLELVSKAAAPGVKTRDLDLLAAEEIKRQGALPAFLGYRGFPGTICASLNEEIVHGIPGNRVIQAGIIQMEAPLAYSSVRLMCPRCNRPARVGFTSLDDGKKVRVCKKCHETIE